MRCNMALYLSRIYRTAEARSMSNPRHEALRAIAAAQHKLNNVNFKEVHVKDLFGENVFVCPADISSGMVIAGRSTSLVWIITFSLKCPSAGGRIGISTR